MASEMKIWFVLLTVLLVFINLSPLLVKGEQQVPCLFIMGDSLFDNGNNNNLFTTAKANYPPYGIDFPDGPTGRFTNGKNTADFIADLLGFDKYIEPFATVKGVEMFRGVNYASGAAGIRDESGIHLTLYSYGARKVAVFGLGSIGCILAELDLYGTKDSPCVDSINSAVLKFVDKLKPMIDDFNSNLPNANFIYINVTSIAIGDPAAIGITNLADPCCEISSFIAKGQCSYGGSACNDRASHYFWDGFHPTEAPNKATAERAYTALLPTDAYPFDISHLALL
ncbi:GDSL esterase/lipase At1g29670 isoform X2 [Nicotiana tabacum]|uniref:GDSL esterase/lipase At1g29670 isoform X2 n=1 Tax=Nicotiana tabacum TaxID=4097 RepID=A0AC58U9Y3_TOBAC